MSFKNRFEQHAHPKRRLFHPDVDPAVPGEVDDEAMPCYSGLSMGEMRPLLGSRLGCQSVSFQPLPTSPPNKMMHSTGS
ncbi:hypothetical protein ColTof4_14236 [Colletotrichum tofieldiae]|nr:hypothetical protein ColTof3_00078 [Colletotrichum tofieldiae]GKT81813.1 hypothetical protein ColTof4_14236 [Colletotrichum tofieldiae]